MKIMRPAPFEDMGVTIPDIFGKSTYSFDPYEGAEPLYITDQADFLVMRSRGEYEVRSLLSQRLDDPD
jgi:hypothetical protein